RVGLINPISHKFCNNCNRLRLTADGKLKPCLHSEQEIDLRGVLRTAKSEDKQKLLQEAIIEAIQSKPRQHTLDDLKNKPIDRDMYTIGG
ncbi:MAG: GTP 3',8-cyclase MoaA, partial [Pseudomonadota bacterium]